MNRIILNIPSFLLLVVTVLSGCASGGDTQESGVGPKITTKAVGPTVHQVTVNPDGSFYPSWTYINSGDTVEWHFSDRSDTIIPVIWNGPGADLCSAYHHYNEDNPNEFTGPMPRAASGIFTLSPDGPGYVMESRDDPNASCNERQSAMIAADQMLCATGPEYATMDWTWQQPDITGVFIRLRWNEVHLGPGLFDWTVLDEQIDKAVQNGKLYSLSFKGGAHGTPEWIFDAAVTGAGNEAIRVEVRNDNCGQLMAVGSPADPNYRSWYLQLLSEAAQHIKDRNAWFRALAYIKPSGANLFSHENRLANSCDCGCDICNPERWATVGNYTPSQLLSFYQEQTALLAQALPGKDMSYMLIQAGFPLVNDNGEYETCPPTPTAQPLPKGTEQTENVLKQGAAQQGLHFVVQHNGLGPRPQDRDPPLAPCPNEGVHPAAEPFSNAGTGCPNKWVLQAGVQGQVTGFQTNNLEEINTAQALESTLQNAWDNSDAVFVEIYESLFWKVIIEGGPLDPTKSNQTLAQWTELFHQRRRDDWISKGLDDPFPSVYRKTFQRTAAGRGNQLLHYINGSKCSANDTPRYGVIAIRP